MLNLFFVLNVALILGITGVGVYFSYIQAHSFVRSEGPPLSVQPDVVGLNNWQDVTFTAADGIPLSGWYIPPTTAPAPAVMFLHGVQANREQHLRVAKLLHDAGYGVLLFDMRNHGMSGGEHTTMGALEALDAVAAFEWLATQPTVDAERIALYGHSMGGATAIMAMAQLPQAHTLIVDTAYTSLRDVVGDGVNALTGLPPFPWDWLVVWMTGRMSNTDAFAVRPIDAIPTIAPRPVLFLHGSADSTISLKHGRALYDAAQDPKQWVVFEGAGHGGLYEYDPPLYETTILTFLDTAFTEANP
jgi:uncharacterized protein